MKMLHCTDRLNHPSIVPAVRRAEKARCRKRSSLLNCSDEKCLPLCRAIPDPRGFSLQPRARQIHCPSTRSFGWRCLMKLVVVAVFVLGLLTAANDKQDPKKDLEALQVSWFLWSGKQKGV